MRAWMIGLLILVATGCAGTEGRPEYVRKVLNERYLGKPVDVAVVDLGAPDKITQLDSGRKVYTFRRQTNKSAANVFIKSDERCVITMMTTVNGDIVETIGEVDDSLGMWQFSYCAEELDL